FIEEHKRLGFTTREEFIRDAVRWRLRFLREDYEYIEVPREECERVMQAIRDMELPFLSVNEFVEQQIKNLLEKYAEYSKQKEAYERRSRKRE
ncbi:MAG: hypothetical protein QXV01_11015, partial [Candidatus Bathyarchaeia archaeon]